MEIKIGDTFISNFKFCKKEVICTEKPKEDTKHCKNCIFHQYGYNTDTLECNKLKCFSFERKDKKDIIFKDINIL